MRARSLASHTAQATSAPGPHSPCHICFGTGLTLPKSAPGLRSASQCSRTLPITRAIFACTCLPSEIEGPNFCRPIRRGTASHAAWYSLQTCARRRAHARRRNQTPLVLSCKANADWIRGRPLHGPWAEALGLRLQLGERRDHACGARGEIARLRCGRLWPPERVRVSCGGEAWPLS